MKNDDSIEPLLNALQTNSGLVQRYAAGMLGRLGNEEAIEPLIEALHAENRGVQLQAARALMKIGERAVPSLIMALRDNKTSVWQLAAAILVKVGQPAVPYLMISLKNDVEAIQILVVEILGQIGDPDSIQALVDTLRHDNNILQTTTALAITRIGEPALEALFNCVLDFHGGDIPGMVAEIVRKIGDSAIPFLAKIMYEGNDVERNQAGWLLSEIGEPALSSLREALYHRDKNVRYTAAWSLGNIPNNEAMQDLIKCLADDSKSTFSGLRVSDAAAKSLERIGTLEAVTALRDWQRNRR